MSLILDALNRSRQDAEPVPGIATTHAVEARIESPLRRYFPWIALSIAIAVILLLVFGRGSGSESSESTQDSAVQALSENVGSALSSVKSELQSQNQVQQADLLAQQPNVTQQAPSATYQSAPTARTERLVPAVPDAPPPRQMREQKPAAQTTPPDPAVAALYASPPTTDPVVPQTRKVNSGDAEVQPAVAVEETPIDVEAMIAQARAALDDAQLREHPAPFLADLSQQAKDSIPTILYQQHNYASANGQSSVVLNGKTIREGGSAASGVKVKEILPQSAVLEYRGTEFRLRSLNSWVNL